MHGISYYGRVRGTADSPSPKGWGLKHTCRRPRHVNIDSILHDNWTPLEMGYRLVCGCDRYYGWMGWIGWLTIETPDHFASWDEGLDASRTTIQAGRNKPTKGWHITSIVSDQLPHWAGFWKQCQIKLGLMSWYRTTWIRWIEKISVSNSFDLRSTCIVPISIIQTSVSYYPILANPLSSTQFCRSFSNSDHTASIQHPAPCLSCLVLTA